MRYVYFKDYERLVETEQETEAGITNGVNYIESNDKKRIIKLRKKQLKEYTNSNLGAKEIQTRLVLVEFKYSRRF